MNIKHITDLIDILQERCPTVFPKKPFPKVPIAYNQHKVIQRILNVNYSTANYILQLWCHGKRYDLACSTAGSPRIRCDGVAKGTVSAKEALWHKSRLDAYYASRRYSKADDVRSGLISEIINAKEPKTFFGMLKDMLGMNSVFSSPKCSMFGKEIL